MGDKEARTSGKFIKIRQDLQDYFEVVSHEDSTLRCKLSGQDKCKIANSTIKYRSQQGWYNFERHVIRVHNVSPSVFGKSVKPGKGQTKGNGKKKIKKQNETEEMEVEEASEGVIADSERTWTEIKWANLLIREKFCLVCRNVCQTDGDNPEAEEHFWSTLKRLFPGCEGSVKLGVHLFSIFFLRNVIDFPVDKCEELLKKCRGQRTPETWFNLCLTCREVAIKAAAINQQLIGLRNELVNLKELIISKFQAQVESDSVVRLSKIEESIRNHILDRTESNLNEEVYSDGDVSYEQDFLLSAIKTEIDGQRDTTNLRSSRGRRTETGNGLPKRFNEMSENDDHALDDSSSLITDAFIKIEPDCSNPITNTDTEENIDFPIDESSDSYNGNDDDEDYQPEVANSDSDMDIPVNTPKESIKKKRVANGCSQPNRAQKILKACLSRIKSRSSDRKPVKKKPKIHLCQLCPAKYKSHRSLREHLEAHEISKTRDNKYDCQHCGFPCPSEKAKVRHINTKHGREGGFRCSLCNFSSPTNKLLKQHLLEHKQEAERNKVNDKYLCTMCRELFVAYDVLCRHIRSTHYKEVGAIPYQCEYCDMMLSSKRHLRDHIQQTHRKQSRFFCEICGKGTLYMSKLRRHMDVHIKEKRFVCEICGADFVYSETLRKHIQKEHPEATKDIAGPSFFENCSRKYTCKHCSVEFPSVTLLNRHIKTDHEELFSNKCDLCGKGYATTQSLRRHKEINHSEHQLPCTFCGKRFPHQEYIRQHLKFCKQYPNRKDRMGATSESIATKRTNGEIDKLIHGSTEGQLESEHSEGFRTTSTLMNCGIHFGVSSNTE